METRFVIRYEKDTHCMKRAKTSISYNVFMSIDWPYSSLVVQGNFGKIMIRSDLNLRPIVWTCPSAVYK